MRNPSGEPMGTPPSQKEVREQSYVWGEAFFKQGFEAGNRGRGDVSLL